MSIERPVLTLLTTLPSVFPSALKIIYTDNWTFLPREATNRKWGNEAVKRRGFHRSRPTAHTSSHCSHPKPLLSRGRKYIIWTRLKARLLHLGRKSATKSVIFFKLKSKAGNILAWGQAGLTLVSHQDFDKIFFLPPVVWPGLTWVTLEDALVLKQILTMGRMWRLAGRHITLAERSKAGLVMASLLSLAALSEHRVLTQMEISGHSVQERR